FGGSLTVGTLFAFIGYLTNFFDPVQQLSQLYNTFLAAVAALDKIIDVMDEEPEVEDAPHAAELPRIEGHVRFEHVRFAYGRSALPGQRPKKSPAPPWPSAPTSSSSSSSTATRPRWASAEAGSLSASASSSPSPGPSSPIRGSSSSTRRRRASTSGRSGGSRS